MPKRIQRLRTRGWRMPENTLYVGRPSKWGNPNIVAEWMDNRDEYCAREKCRDLFEEMLEEMIRDGDCFPNKGNDETVEGWLAPLRGKDLACWCPLDQPCHADVLLRLANTART
ncbi:MAG: DUF4326 domain-containing protein [Chloroflexi bacterium]|nr:DUF4326 domain-containing protein [Chloroflexota bacterium]